MGGSCGTYWTGEKFTAVSVGRDDVKRPLIRPSIRWDNNIEMDLRWEKLVRSGLE
jgi:hypothetical protein